MNGVLVEDFDPQISALSQSLFVLALAQNKYKKKILKIKIRVQASCPFLTAEFVVLISLYLLSSK